MGAPKQKWQEELSKVSIPKKAEGWALAGKTARGFRNFEVRVNMMEHVRSSLKSLTRWLDQPAKKYFQWAINCGTLQAATGQVMPVFRGYDDLHHVALTREGQWTTIAPIGARIGARLTRVSSADVVSNIYSCRFSILASKPRYFRRECLAAAESIEGLRAVVEHCAFLVYLRDGMNTIRENLIERWRRLDTMDYNIAHIEEITLGSDPLTRVPAQLPEYQLMREHSRGTSDAGERLRFTSDFLDREAERWNAMPAVVELGVHKVNELSLKHDSLEFFLGRVSYIFSEASKKRMSEERPITEEEKEVIAKFVREIGVPSS